MLRPSRGDGSERRSRPRDGKGVAVAQGRRETVVARCSFNEGNGFSWRQAHSQLNGARAASPDNTTGVPRSVARGSDPTVTLFGNAAVSWTGTANLGSFTIGNLLSGETLSSSTLPAHFTLTQNSDGTYTLAYTGPPGQSSTTVWDAALNSIKLITALTTLRWVRPTRSRLQQRRRAATTLRVPASAPRTLSTCASTPAR